MNKEQFEELRSKQDLSDLHFPNHHIWTYCLFLGKFTDSKGEHYDLGVHFNEGSLWSYKFSDATVYGNEPYEYSSGVMDFDLIPHTVDNKPNDKPMSYWYAVNGFEAKIECNNRLNKLLNEI